MNIEDVESTLPNGLHDAVLKKFEVDYEAKTATFSFNVWVGDLDSKSEEIREAYRSGTLTLHELKYIIIDPPGADINFNVEPFSSGTGCHDTESIPSTKNLPAAPEGTFRQWFFLYKLETFIHVCAAEAVFSYDT